MGWYGRQNTRTLTDHAAGEDWRVYRQVLEDIAVDEGCWEWVGSMGRYGYGRIRWSIDGISRSRQAHRVVFEVLRGAVADDLVLDHLCRNRACVRPSHLEPVTGAENVMRGIGFAPRNATKTHCPRGHEYTPENTRVDRCGSGTPTRKCRTCLRERQRIARGAA